MHAMLLCFLFEPTRFVFRLHENSRAFQCITGLTCQTALTADVLSLLLPSQAAVLKGGRAAIHSRPPCAARLARGAVWPPGCPAPIPAAPATPARCGPTVPTIRSGPTARAPAHCHSNGWNAPIASFFCVRVRALRRPGRLLAGKGLLADLSLIDPL